MGFRKYKFKTDKTITGNIFKPSNKLTDVQESWKKQIFKNADQIMLGHFKYFSEHIFKLNEIPSWFYNPFHDTEITDYKKHWLNFSDFDLNIGDIKIIWELSRFDWLYDLSLAYKSSGDQKYLLRINRLLNDWNEKNPLNIGPNWKCGQETSFRIMKLLTTAFVLDQLLDPTVELKSMIYQHLKRVYPNINYAIAQDNNHGTSEAAALYIGGLWLEKNNFISKEISTWKNNGRKVLEERIRRLVQPQGSFSQRSMTYHRVLLDTMTFTLHMMKLMDQPLFPNEIISRLEQLGQWQYKMTLGKDGDGPNYGSNDGARIESLNTLTYRDFRGSTQAFFGALLQKRVYDSRRVDESLFWRFGATSFQWPKYNISLEAAEILDNQILLLRNKNLSCFLKIPEASFRPNNDAFHIDIWYNGKPVVIGTGTYSYNHKKSEWYKSVSAHNTIQFGEHNQMPKISRFLNGSWITAEHIGEIKKLKDGLSWNGSYKDFKGNHHQRNIMLNSAFIHITDLVNTNEPYQINYHIDQICKDTNNVHFTSSELIEYEVSPRSTNYMKEEHGKSIALRPKSHEAWFRISVDN